MNTDLEEIRAKVLRMEACLIYLQAQIRVSDAAIATAFRDQSIGGKTFREFIDEQVARELHLSLATLSDTNPQLASELTNILKHGGVSF